MANDQERVVKEVQNAKYSINPFRPTDRRELNISSTGNYTAKLDRSELENRYLRFFEENINLKKHCHNQEEKIKRLAAKLLRLAAEQRNSNKGAPSSKYSNLEVEDLISRVDELERSNQLLREKLMVAGIQLSTHHPPRIAFKSPQRFSIRCTSGTDFSGVSEHTAGNTSGIIDQVNSGHHVEQTNVPRSGCQFLEQEVSKLRNELLNYEKELEDVREQSNARVQALEDELTRVQNEGSRMANALSAASAAAQTSVRNLEQTSRRVAENVEIIRLQRNVKAQEEQLHRLESERMKALEDLQILGANLEAKQKENSELNEHILNEREQISELQNELQRLSANYVAIQELQEEINDLQKEKAVLQDANTKLVQSIMEEEPKDHINNSQTMEVMKENQECHTCKCQLQSDTGEKCHKELEIQFKKSQEIQEESLRKEKEIEKRVKELEEQLRTKVELEKETQKAKEQEENREKERAIKEKEREKLLLVEAAKQEKLKQKVIQTESFLKLSNLEKDDLKEELKMQKTLINELQSNNSMLIEKLSSKNLEIYELQKAQKEFIGKLKIDANTQYDVEEKDDIITPDEYQNEEVNEKEQQKNSKQTDLSEEDSTKFEEKVESNKNNEITDEHIINVPELQNELHEVTHNLEITEKLLQEQYKINLQYQKEISKLSNLLEVNNSKYDGLLEELKHKESQTVDDSSVKKKEVLCISDRNKELSADQCAFELYIESILLSERGKEILQRVVAEEPSPSPGIFLTWIFYEEDAAYTPIFKGPDAHMNCSYSVIIPVKTDFFDYLDKETLIIELHAAVDDISVPVAFSKISFRECLNYPQRKLRHSAPLIAWINKQNCQRQGILGMGGDVAEHEFGILQYEFGLDCPSEQISEYNKRMPKRAQKIIDSPGKNGIASDGNISNDKKVEKEEDIISSPVAYETDNYEETSNLTEIIKKVPKPMPRNTKNVSNLAFEDSGVKTPQIIIEIHSFCLAPESYVAEDANIQQLFVEYTFLGKLGESMETPASLPKPLPNEKIFFNFKKVFPMDPIHNAAERNLLHNMIHVSRSKQKKKTSLLAEGKIHFNVVSEPLEDNDPEAECLDIGFAELSIPEILASREDIIQRDFDVINSNGSQEVVGYLNISFLAINVLQSICNHF